MFTPFGPPGTAHVWEGRGLFYYVQDDGSVERIEAASDGTHFRKNVYFSTKTFLDRICQARCCFMCGVDQGAKGFNNEHILPRWVLKRFGLFDKRIVVGNGAGMRYGSYTLPCCTECNTLLGEGLEQPVRDLVDSLQTPRQVTSDELWLLFRWLCLILAKTHLKDALVPVSPDPRSGLGQVGDVHDFAALHHAHCIARSIYTGAAVERAVVGSILLVDVKIGPEDDPFDFADSIATNTMLLRMGSLGIVVVFDDCGAVASKSRSVFLDRVHGRLSAVQLREVMVRFAHMNLHLENRPNFYSGLGPEGLYQIVASHEPSPRFSEGDPETMKVIFKRFLGDAIRQHPDSTHLIAAAEKNTLSFLFDDQGRFIAS